MSDWFNPFKKALRHTWLFNLERLQTAFSEVKFIYGIARANRLFWPGVFIGFIVLTSVAVNLNYLVQDKMLVLVLAGRI